MPARQAAASAIAYAADPASTGTPRIPVPTRPIVNSAAAAGPATGLSADAASAAVSTSVTPAACSVAAAVRMMKYMIAFEKNIPTLTSRVAARSPRWIARAGPPKLALARALCPPDDPLPPIGSLFGVLCRLPEKEIRRDRRAEDGD